MPIRADATTVGERTHPARFIAVKPESYSSRPSLPALDHTERSAADEGGDVLSRVEAVIPAPKIYYLHFPLLGGLAEWPRHLERCRGMGFDYLAIPPPFAPGERGNPFLVADFDLPSSALGSRGNADEVIDKIIRLCADYGLKLIIDIVLDRVAAKGIFAVSHYSWFRFPAVDREEPPDPRRVPQPRDAAVARFEEPDVAGRLEAWWVERLVQLTHRGVTGFRCLDLDLLPVEMWRRIIAKVRQRSPHCLFLGWTLGFALERVDQLAGIRFDYVFAATDDGETGVARITGDYEALRRIARVIAAPETPFGPRLARAGGGDKAAYRRAFDLAASTMDGVMVPIGFEFAASRPLDPVYSAPADLSAMEVDAPFSLVDDIARANARLDTISRLGVQGRVSRLTDSGTVAAILRMDAADPRWARQALLILVNPDLGKSHVVDITLSPLPAAAGAAFNGAARLDGDEPPDLPLAPGEVRVLSISRSAPITFAPRSRPLALRAAREPRIAIEDITPTVDGGRFATKRVIGESIEVEADIFIDGHEALAATLLWRAVANSEWQRVPMMPLINDRWHAAFTPSRVGRHVYTIEAWNDQWAGVTRDMAKRREGGQNLSLDVADAIALVRTAEKRTRGGIKRDLTELLAKLEAAGESAKLAQILGGDAAAIMAAADEQPFLVRSEPEIPVDVDRPQAVFASWYEMFPRSASNDARQSGTFDDVISRLPAIRAMGFDVLYFPPIHPIGATNRKGRNNALAAGPDDPGSPYAIGSEAGGHTAIDAALGSLEDFQRLRDAAAEHGLEIALDFAVQCSPDHPWLKQHPDWFRRRSDGSIRYAENPPKTYEDIVNPDFYAPAAVPNLWLALRDAVLFWVNEGIRTVRVDNPHTKPLAFWEWMIGDIHARQPEVVFLAEAFTRPKLMYRLAKLGFTQSYSYFTWRNTKQELTEYLTELTRGAPRNFFRPNFFVNTPDINPFFLQHSGRAGFLIRAALAATLSGLWGMYSGFELCEAAGLPGREEYLDSEKYQIRVRDFEAPGNIVREIAALNRIRRNNLGLQNHLGLTFYNAFNDQILLYGKAARTPDHMLREMVLVAVNLDPHHVQEATFELPLWEFGLPDHGSLRVEDLLRGNTFTLSGKVQFIRLDPGELPFAIWRLSRGY